MEIVAAISITDPRKWSKSAWRGARDRKESTIEEIGGVQWNLCNWWNMDQGKIRRAK